MHHPLHHYFQTIKNNGTNQGDTTMTTETVADRENFDGYLFEGNSELVTANHRVAGLTETLAKERKSHEPLKGNE